MKQGTRIQFVRQSLSDELAQRVRQLIHSGGYQPGDRLPSIAKMARDFGVAHPTLREALRKLETLRLVDIRHGSGVYVCLDENALVITNPVFEGEVTPGLLLDLVEVRILIEKRAVALAAERATDEQLARMREVLSRAGQSLDDPPVLSEVNLAFHREIALASGNQVLHQMLRVLANIIQQEQRVVLETYGSRESLHHEHVAILEAMEERDSESAVARMQAHLERVRIMLLRWGSQEIPEVQ